MTNRIPMGRFGKPHGIKGWIKVHSYTDPIANLLHYQPWYVTSNNEQQTLAIVTGQPQATHLLVKLADYATPESVRHLTNQTILVDRNQLMSLPSGEYYWTDLIGLTVKTVEQVPLGTLHSLFNTGANDIMVVRQGQRERLIPFLTHVVISIDLEQKYMIVDWDPDF